MKKPTLDKYHSIEQECQIKELDWGAKCENHDVKICRCGWEWGWHYGTYSPLLKKEKQYKDNLT